MKNKIPLTFEQATLKAASYVEHNERLLRLLGIAGRKSHRYYESLFPSWDSLQMFLRMIRASVSGKYCAPPETILMLVAAVIYFLSPFDLIPDDIPVFGLMDDAVVIECVVKANLTALNNFRKWEILSSETFPFPAAERLPPKVGEAVADIVRAVGEKRWGSHLGKTKSRLQ
jgi:uncharacterized membrane protein YkvA (DUF1232 family)